MSSLNFRHLLYFRAVAHEGGVTAAAEELNVSQPAISTQIQKLEAAIGYQLFDRSGRSMTLTPEGRIVLEYADEIFRLGRELEETIRSQMGDRPMRLAVGLAGTIPNLVAMHLLEAAFGLAGPLRLEVHENRPDQLLAELATHELDLVLADTPIPPTVSIRAFNHPLGSSPVDIFAPPLLAHELEDGFPDSLDGAPFLLPALGYALRSNLDGWFAEIGIQPRVVAEIEDNDLINVLAEGGVGAFAAPSVITDDIRVRYAVERLGRAEGLREQYFAITVHRQIRHPAVAAITEAAKIELSAEWAKPGGIG